MVSALYNVVPVHVKVQQGRSFFFSGSCCICNLFRQISALDRMPAHINHRLCTTFATFFGRHRIQGRLGRPCVRGAPGRRVHSSIAGTLEGLLTRKWLVKSPATKAMTFPVSPQGSLSPSFGANLGESRAGEDGAGCPWHLPSHPGRPATPHPRRQQAAQAGCAASCASAVRHHRCGTPFLPSSFPYTQQNACPCTAYLTGRMHA